MDDLTEQIIGAAMEVSTILGPGFLEKVYERALLRELNLRGLKTKTQVRYPVIYKGHSVGEYTADLLVESQILIELKCTDHLIEEHLAQCLNYLKASKKELCLLMNFQKPKLQWKRIILTT
jgi:GxxExxY protein